MNYARTRLARYPSQPMNCLVHLDRNRNTRPTLFTIRDNLGRMNAILLFQKLRFHFNDAAPEQVSEG